MKKDFLIIWGVAHSPNVAGKQSPDGRHHEPVWSLKQCKLLDEQCRKEGINSAVVQPKSDSLAGRVAFVRECEALASKYKTTIVIPLHNNAAGNGLWMNAHGWCLYTSPGYTRSDVYAKDLFERFKAKLPELPVRYNSLKEPDFEAAFTTLMGWNYYAVLIEWLFQDNKEDLALIENESICDRMREVLIDFAKAQAEA
ncbi:MAG TPA: N-acetylmuramoyl-L-alanine amidase [Bacteroidales bacterium]|nr:N-acetylmuramoyl-L-alanine amidase [Bacteroidales bacterium]HPS16741.1 N-acetylmuramoyl-L-alanine amidase [Bacteroidales bacterium]